LGWGDEVPLSEDRGAETDGDQDVDRVQHRHGDGQSGALVGELVQQQRTSAEDEDSPQRPLPKHRRRADSGLSDEYLDQPAISPNNTPAAAPSSSRRRAGMVVVWAKSTAISVITMPPTKNIRAGPSSAVCCAVPDRLVVDQDGEHAVRRSERADQRRVESYL
jgi:hypothetical protein